LTPLLYPPQDVDVAKLRINSKTGLPFNAGLYWKSKTRDKIWMCATINGDRRFKRTEPGTTNHREAIEQRKVWLAELQKEDSTAMLLKREKVTMDVILCGAGGAETFFV
jgi:hypothetical protein